MRRRNAEISDLVAKGPGTQTAESAAIDVHFFQLKGGFALPTPQTARSKTLEAICVC